MGQPETVNQLRDRCPDFEPKIYVVKNCLYNPITPYLWDIVPTNEVKGVTFNLFWNKMSYTSVKMSKIVATFQFAPSSLLRF